VDILINNAGVAHSTPFESVTEAEYDKIMTVNARAPYFMTQRLLPALRSSSSPTIINVSSAVAKMGYPLQSVYSMSKHALLGFSESLAKEVYKEGIRVHALCPGGVYTDMIKISRPDLSQEGMIMPEDIADIVEFLLTHRSNAVIDEICVHRAGKTPFSL
jgi:short-subunit dehydrogenase